MAWIKAFKGFDKNMQCRGFQFNEGETYETDEAKLCESGFHACENPLDTFTYYAPGKGSIYRAVELDSTDEKENDTKRCGKRIRIGAALSVADLCKAHFEYVKERTTHESQGENKANLAAQDGSSLAARNCSSLAARNYSSLAAGKNSVIAAFNSKAKGGLGTLIAIANRKMKNGELVITDFCAGIVDGEKIKADTWYKVENGAFVEVKDNE